MIEKPAAKQKPKSLVKKLPDELIFVANQTSPSMYESRYRNLIELSTLRASP